MRSMRDTCPTFQAYGHELHDVRILCWSNVTTTRWSKHWRVGWVGEFSEDFATAGHHKFLAPIDVSLGVGKWEKMTLENGGL